MLNAMGNFVAKIPLNELQPRQCYVEWTMELEIPANPFVLDAYKLMYHDPLLFPSFATEKKLKNKNLLVSC